MNAINVFALAANLGLAGDAAGGVSGTVPLVVTGTVATGILDPAGGDTGFTCIDEDVGGRIAEGSPEEDNLPGGLVLAPSATDHLRLNLDFLGSSSVSEVTGERSMPFAVGKGDPGALNGLGESGTSLE